MQKTRMNWFKKRDPKEESISQINSNGLEFAVASSRAQCSHFVYCKDFLHDAVWAVLYDTPVEIHGFKYDPKAHPIDVYDLTRVLVANESDEFFDKRIPNCLEFLNKVESALHLKRTVAYQCDNPPEHYLPGGVFLLEGSQRWMSSPPLLSMYTMFVRCGFVHKMGDDYMATLEKIISGETKAYQENDKEFVKSSMPGIKAIMELGYRKIFYIDMKRNYPKNISTSTLHHDCGIRAYSWGYTSKTVPYWHRPGLLDILKQRGVTIENLWTVPPPPPLPPMANSNHWGQFAAWKSPAMHETVAVDGNEGGVDKPIISKDVKSEMKETKTFKAENKNMVSMHSPKHWD